MDIRRALSLLVEHHPKNRDHERLMRTLTGHFGHPPDSKLAEYVDQVRSGADGWLKALPSNLRCVAALRKARTAMNVLLALDEVRAELGAAVCDGTVLELKNAYDVHLLTESARRINLGLAEEEDVDASNAFEAETDADAVEAETDADAVGDACLEAESHTSHTHTDGCDSCLVLRDENRKLRLLLGALVESVDGPYAPALRLMPSLI